MQQGQGISEKVKDYKKKFYRNLLIGGFLLSTSIVLSFYLLANIFEYLGRFSTGIRAAIFIGFIITSISLLIIHIIVPFLKSRNIHGGMGDEDAARQIGSYFPEIKDKLLNIIQLQQVHDEKNKLLQASISQKSAGLIHIPFVDAIDSAENKKYLRFLIPLVIIFILVFAFSPRLFRTSTERIVHFKKEYLPEAPFQFVLKNPDLLAFKNEDFLIQVKLTGDAIPENVYLISNDRKVKMNKGEEETFEFTIPKIQAEKKFHFESAGFSSSEYLINVATRPNLKSFDVYISYPPYLEMEPDRFSNVGNLEIPEGSVVTWSFQPLEASSLSMEFKSAKDTIRIQNIDNQSVEAKKQFFRSDEYEIKLKNEYSENSQRIAYAVNVIPDRYPEIRLNVFQDTTLYSFIILAGNLDDDYGINKLKVFYQLQGSKKSDEYASFEIPLASHQNSQSFYHEWTLNDLGLKEGNQLNYFLQVWDNDGINGSKSTKTGTYSFKIPTKEDLKKEIEASSGRSENKIEETIEKAKDLNKKLDDAENRLKGKKDLDWQDQNLIKDILNQKQELEKALQELSDENKSNALKRQRFQEENDRIREKVEQLQKLMDELLDDETKKLYEELQKLLEENKSPEDYQRLLDQINKKEDNLEKELERTLELFKKMKFEYKLNEAIKDLEELAKEQEELADKTLPKTEDQQDGQEQNKKDQKEEVQQQNKDQGENAEDDKGNQDMKDGDRKNQEDLIKEQQELNKQFEENKENLEEIQDLNQDLKNPRSLEDYKEEQQQIDENQQKGLENLKNNNNRNANQNQKNASQKMKQLSQKLQQMQGAMEMQVMTENLENLRDILHNLLQLSFDQEKLMDEFKEINQSDPRFVDFSQEQLKIKDDAKIVEDSLFSLANRVFQIRSFVTREVAEMNNNIDDAMEILRDRERNVISKVTSKQQFAMTSMNNLALMLDDVLQQMQQAMADAMGNPQNGKGNMRMPSLSELQQMLNQQIQQLKESGKSGRELSEELARLAAEQERIRRALEEAKEKLNQGQGQGDLDEIMNKMEDTELDLVNKKLTDETIKRQKEIETRLLDAENSLRERDEDDEREGETAKTHENLVPKAFEDYFKLKEKEIELLKTVPLKLYPYYKKEVNEYFKRIGEN